MRLVLLVLGVLVLGPCSKSADERDAPKPLDLPPIPAKAMISATDYANASAGHETWRASSLPCPLAMNPMPQPKVGQDLGSAALDQGQLANRLSTTFVKSFDDGTPPSPLSVDVPVLYVETERKEPVADTANGTFTSGVSKGIAYVWDRATKSFACIAKVDARSSSNVTSLGAGDRNATMWLTLDLMAAVERQIASNAMIIDRAGAANDASAPDAGKRAASKQK